MTPWLHHVVLDQQLPLAPDLLVDEQQRPVLKIVPPPIHFFDRLVLRVHKESPLSDLEGRGAREDVVYEPEVLLADFARGVIDQSAIRNIGRSKRFEFHFLSQFSFQERESDNGIEDIQ